MEADQDLAELRSKVDSIEQALGARVAVLERQVAVLEALSSRRRDAVPGPPAGLTPTGVTPAGIPPGVPGPPPPSGTPMPPPPARPTTGPPAGVTTPPPPPPPPSSSQSPSHPPAWSPPPAPAPAGPRFEVGVEAILRWAGIGLVVLSAIFLVSTAISRGWIGPELQLLGATAIGFALLGAAMWFVDRQRSFALAFANGGAVVVIVCAGAAYSWLDLYSALTALVFVAGATAVSVAVAWRLRMESVAVVSTAAMLLVPTFARILADAPVMATGIWLGSFAICATAIGLQRGWAIYRIVSTWSAALWVFGLASILYEDGNTDHVIAGLALVTVVGLLLWLNPLLADRRLAGAPEVPTGFSATVAGLEHRTAVMVPLWSWGAGLLFAGLEASDPGGWIGLVLAAGFVAAAVLAGPIERWISDHALGSHLLGAGLLVTASTVAWLGGPVLVVIIAGQAVATLVIGNYFSDRWLKANAYLLGLLAWLMLAVGVAEALDTNSTSVADHLTHGVVVLLLGVLAWLTTQREDETISAAINGMAWLAFVGFVCSVVDPHIADREWLFVGVALAAVGVVAARAAGIYVLGISAMIALITVVATVPSVIDAAESGTDAIGHLANLSVVASLAIGTYILWFIEKRLWLARPMLVAAWIGSLGWLASVLLAGPQGQVAVSVCWALAACVILVAGIRTEESVVRVLGLGTLGVVLAKLLTVDLAEVDTLWRVGLFLVIGLGLLRLGYVLPSLAKRNGTEQPEVG